MPNRNIGLTTVQDAFIDRLVPSGTRQNASEAVRDALRLIQPPRLEDTAKLKQLRRHVPTGLNELTRGDFVEVETDGLERFLGSLSART